MINAKDGSADVGNVEVEIIVILHCCKDDDCKEMRYSTRFLSVVMPKNADNGPLMVVLMVLPEMLVNTKWYITKTDTQAFLYKNAFSSSVFKNTIEESIVKSPTVGRKDMKC